MILYLILAAAILLWGKLLHANRNDRRKKWFLLGAFGAMILVAALRAPSVGIDLANHYAKRYTQIAAYRWSEVPAFAKMSTYEIGYCYYCKLLSVINPNVQFFIAATALFTIGSMGIFIYRKSPDVILSTELMLMLCIYYAHMNVIRQQLAISFVLAGYLLLSESRKRIPDYALFVFFCVLASSFHTSAIVCVVFILFYNLKFKRRDILLVFGGTVFVFVAYERLYLLVAAIIGRGAGYVNKLEGQGNFNPQSLVNFLLTVGAFALGYYILVWRPQRIRGKEALLLKQEETFLLYASLMASLCRMLLFQMNIINRVTYYFIPFTLIMYPYAIAKIPVKKVRQHYRALVYLSCGAYFVWITLKLAGQFYGSVPYIPFWKG